VVGVLSLALVHVQGQGPGRGEGAPELLGQLGIERRFAESDGIGSEWDVVRQIRTARQIERDLDQGLVEGKQEGGETPDARFVPKRLGQH